MLLYYVTDRRSFEGTDARQRITLLERIAAAARAGVDYIQLREKDLSPRPLERLAREALHAVRENSAATRLLINGRTDIALAVGADGVHLPSGELPASEIRALWACSNRSAPIIGVSAHSVADIQYAEAHGANFAVLAPIFEKVGTETRCLGEAALRAACMTTVLPDKTEAPPSNRFPVLALGGVTVANARSCLLAGAAGISGIRLFQQGDIADTVRQLREAQPAR
jgi:thiamine-phosphate pyrophosphorylase